MNVRGPAVADLFYPGASAALRDSVGDLLAGAAADTAQDVPKVLVVPHAGYVYSGGLAARAYRLLRPAAAEIRRVVLLGPAHRVRVAGMALPAADAFATPLGEVRIDAGLAELVAALPSVTVSAAAHAEEHSLEVQLPFLQAVLGDFTLLPLVVGGATPEQVAAVLAAVWGGPETVIVISTDLSHFHDDASARRIDGATAARIEAFCSELHGEQACGAAPLNGLLLCARRRAMQIHCLGLCNSADSVGSPDRVVGYGAWALHEDGP